MYAFALAADFAVQQHFEMCHYRKIAQASNLSAARNFANKRRKYSRCGLIGAELRTLPEYACS
jgi:hypothetical protein